jgi:leucyl/phenylalanyl-tRNA--protein transferase
VKPPHPEPEARSLRERSARTLRQVDLTELLRRVVHAQPFPEPDEASDGGLLCYGGDLTVDRLLSAYASGIFPWFDEPPILWFSPDPRMVLVPSELHVAKSLRKRIDSGRYEVRFDHDFESVIRACAATPRPGQDGTWITPEMIDAYCELHALGFAHSAESYEDGELAGGCYGLSLGRAFFGESMFAHRTDASKVAFVTLVRRCQAWDFDFVDCQLHTPHLERFGAVEWPRARFVEALARALDAPTWLGSWAAAADPRDA